MVLTMEKVSWEIFGDTCKYGHVIRYYMEMGVTGPIVWTMPLQDPRHREEQETC
jgi:hypothetical protein